MTMSSSLALLVSIAGILALLRLKIHPGLAIFAGSLIISLLVLPLNSIPAHMLQSLLDRETLRLLVIIGSALTLSSLMEEKGLLSRLASTMESIGPKAALHLIPAVIGLVPMPAGALVSATASRDLVKRVGLNPEQSTFINFWFRHIWEFSMPIYPAIIITSVILSLPLFTVVKTLAPVSALAIIAGGAVSYRILKNIPPVDAKPTKKIVYNLLRAAWPILLLVPLILLGMDAMLAFPLTLLLLAVQQRANWPELRKSLKYGADVKILFMLYAIMLYKATIESSGAASVLIADMQTIGLPAAVMLVALPLLIGLATGISMAFAGITLPLLIPYILTDSGLNTYALLTAYVSGMMGLLLSPLHLCFILSAAYFQANLARMYRYLLPLTMTMEAIVISIYLITA